MKTFDEYQVKILEFMNPKVLEKHEDMLLNAVLGIAGEAGEIADHIKKWMFHDQKLDLDKLDKEVSDQLFYLALYANARDIPFSSIAQINVDKLTKRYEGKPWTAEASAAKRDELQ